MSALIKWKGEANCPEHGAYKFEAQRIGRYTIGQVCPSCLERGQTMGHQKNIEIETAQRRLDFVQRKKIAGMPEAFLECTLETYMPTNDQADEMLGVVKRYAENFKAILTTRPVPGLVFVGVPGTGKTHIACGMMEHLMQQGYSAAYLACPHFLLAARESQLMRSHEKTSLLIERFKQPHFLVLDEFGTHTTQDVDYQILFSVIDGRYQRNLPTLMVTNLNHAELQKKVDERFLERIRGINGPILKFDWPTHRRPNAHVRA